MAKFIAKVAGIVAVVALAAIVSIPSASALSAADIQLLVSLGVIPADKADAAMALAGGTTTTTTACGAYSRDLTLGSTGADVVALQDALVAKGHLVIPTGVSKGYFGALTQSALAKYQAAVGISPTAGYFGPITRAKLSSDCSTTGTGTSTGNTDSSDLSGGEASLESYDRKSSFNNEDLDEGETAKVFAAEFDVEDGDARIERIDVRLEAVTESLEDEPWKQIDEITIFINGDEVDSMNVDDEDAWSRESSNASELTNEVSGNRAYEVRFTGLDTIVEDGDTALVEIEVTASDSIDDSDLTQSWAIWIPTDGIRAIDGEGIDQYTGDNGEYTEFEINAADDGDVTVRESDDDLDSSILVVDTNDKKGPYEVFRFEIDNSEDADVFLNTLVILATSSDEDITDVISDLMIEVDGEEFSYDSASTTMGSTGAYTFDFEDNNDEIPLDQDDRIEVVVKVEFNQAGSSFANYADGTTVQFGVGKVDGTNYAIGLTAEGQSTGDESTVSGRQESAEHTLRTEGVVVEGVSESYSARDNVADDLSDNEGIFTFELEITALEEDAWIDNNVSTTSSTTAGFVATVTGATFTGTSSARIADTTADTITANRYKISEGTSETFEIVVELNPSAEGAYGLELSSVNFASTSDGSQAAYTVPDEAEFEIPTQTIKN